MENLHHLSLYFSGFGGVGLYFVAPNIRSLTIMGIITLEYQGPEKGRDLTQPNQDL